MRLLCNRGSMSAPQWEPGRFMRATVPMTAWTRYAMPSTRSASTGTCIRSLCENSASSFGCQNPRAIELYTSELGYRTMFATINAAFRRDSLTADPFAMRCGVFLVELLSIDLFNYRAANTSADNFEGHVYRGMCVSAEEFQEFARLAGGPLPERYLAIPLAMASASGSMENALAFALEESARAPGRFPLIWDISVSSLDPSLLAAYHAKFPASVVTSLCAVPIDEISDHRDEQEVVLRGAHSQIVRMRELDVGLDRPWPSSMPSCSIATVTTSRPSRRIPATIGGRGTCSGQWY